MRFLVLLLTFFGLGFSIPVILIEKEVTTRDDFRESHRKVKHYIAEGYEKEVWEEKTTTKGTTVNPLPFMKEFMKNMPKQEPRTEINKGEKITHFKKGKVVAYTVYPKNKTYVKNEIEGRMLLMGFMMILDCNQKGECKSRLEPTNERRKIGKWTAVKAIVRVNMFGRETPVSQWYTKDSKLLLKADRLRMRNILTTLKGDPMASSYIKQVLKVADSVQKKYGALVMTETPTGGGVTVEVVKSVKKVDLPESFFRVPKGYQEFKPPFGNQNMYRQR